MASQESDDEMLSGSDQLLIDTSSSDDDDLEDISAEDEEPAEEVEGEEEDDEEEEDDDEDDDWDSDDKEDEEEEEGGPAAGPSQEAASDSSDCADMDCDRCPICLARLRDQDVGTPESCDHCFCLECIQEWAKNVNTCPVDRQPFHLIFARNSLDGVVTKKIEVKDQRLELEEEVVEDLTYCEVCGHSNREDRLLLCDGCDLGYHCECLDPALESVPVGEWFCPGCSATERGPEEPNARPPQTQAQRRIGRTIVSERVRATIQQNRAQASTSARSKQGAAPKRRKKTKRRKQKRKANPKVKSKTAAATSSSTGKKRTKRKRRKKRKTRKMCRTKDSVAPKTVKSRLAGRLGITTPPAGRTLPVKVSARSRALTVQRDIGIAPLTIMPGRDDLDPAWSDSDMPAAPCGSSGGGTAVVQGGQARYISSSRYTKAALNSWRPIPRPHHRKLKEEQIQCTAPFDLLGDILAGQDRMNTNINRVKIHRDGSLEVKPPEKRTLPSKNRAQECQPNDTETTLTSGSTVDRQPPGGSGTAHATDNAQETQDSTDPPSNDVGCSSGDGGDDGCHGDEPHSGGCDAEPVGDCVGHGKAALVEKECDENKKNKLKTSDENRADKSEERTECYKDNSDDSCISCEGYIDNDIDDDSEMAINIGSDTAINVDSDIAISVDTTAADETRTTSSDESCVSGGADKRQQSDTEHEGGAMRQVGACEDVGLVCEDISSGAESIEEMDGAVRQVVLDAAKEESNKVTGNGNCDNENEEESGSGVIGEEVLELNSNVEEGREVVDEEVHELRSSGEEESDLEIIGDDVHERQGSMEERSDHEVTGDDVHELCGRSDEGSDHEVTGDNVHELHGRSDEGSDHEVTGDDVHELHGSGDEGSDHEVIGEENREDETDIKEEIEGSVGSEERTESLPVLSDDADHDSEPEQGVAVADRGETEWKLSDEEEGVDGILPQEAEDSKPDYAHYENISEVEEEEQVLEDGEETGGGSEEDGICEDNNREGHGSASMSHIMVPISELPRIPKKRKTEEVRLPTDGESPHSGVLERLNRPDKVDRYPKWEKRDRNDNGGKSRVRQSDSGGSDVSQEKPREDHSERREEETRRRRRNRSRSSSKEHSHHHKSTKHRHSHHRSRSPDRERSRKRRDRSRERNRDTSRVSARSRSRSPRHRDEMRSKRDRYDRPGKSRQKSESSDYKGSVNMFSRSLKDVGNDSDFASRRFKLRRNSYKDFIPSEIVEPQKRPPSEKLEMYEDKYRSRGRKNVYIEDNRIKVKASVDDLHDDSSSSSSDVIIIESDTETAAAKKRVEKTMSNTPKMKTSVEKTGVGKTISDKPKVKSGIEITSSDNGGDKLGEGHKSSQSPSRVPSQGRQTNSRSPSSVTGEGRPTRSSSPSRVPSQWRQTNSWSPSRVTGEGRKTCSPSQGRQTHSQSPSRVSSQGRVTQMDLTDSCYDPCHPTDSVSPSPPEEPPEPTDLMAGVAFSSANNGQGDMMHPGLRMQTPMLPVDPRIMPPPLPGNIIMPPPPHMTFGMLAPGVRPPPFLVNNHLIGLEQFPPRFTQSRLNWQTINPMQLIQQGRHLVPVTRNGIPMPPPHSGAETFAMDAVAMLPTGLSLQHGLPPREDLGGMYRPPLPPMPAVNNSHSVMPQFSTSSLPNFMSTMKASRQSPGGEGNTFKVPFPPNHPRVMFSMSSDNHGDTKQVGSESNEVVDMDVSSPLSDDLLESFTPPPFHDDDDSKESRGNMRTFGKGKEEVPGSAVELDKQEKYLKKLNRQERVVEEVKLAIKPFYAKGQINKDEYKDIMRKAVPKICHSKSGNINPLKIRSYVQAYVEKVQQLRKYQQKKQHDDVNGHKRRLSSRK